MPKLTVTESTRLAETPRKLSADDLNKARLADVFGEYRLNGVDVETAYDVVRLNLSPARAYEAAYNVYHDARARGW